MVGRRLFSMHFRVNVDHLGIRWGFIAVCLVVVDCWVDFGEGHLRWDLCQLLWSLCSLIWTRPRRWNLRTQLFHTTVFPPIRFTSPSRFSIPSSLLNWSLAPPSTNLSPYSFSILVSYSRHNLGNSIRNLPRPQRHRLKTLPRLPPRHPRKDKIIALLHRCDYRRRSRKSVHGELCR